MKSITTKLLISIGIVAIFFFFFLLYQTYSLTYRHISDVVEQQAAMALKFDLAIREYIAQNVRPLMYELLGEEEFIPETMSTSYVARSIFDDVRNEFPDYIIKFSSDNPRNPANQAGPEELKIIEYLNNNPYLERWEGTISINDKKYMAKFSAMRMEDSCVRCHGDPNDAPASLLKRYGSTASFHRPMGKVIGMDTVAIPMTKISEKLRSEFINAFLVSGLGLLFFFGIIVLIVKFLIINRLTMISQHFTNVAQESNYSEIEPIKMNGKDEIYNLAFSFNVLSEKLKSIYSSLDLQVKERTKGLENTNEQLMQEINERKRAEKSLRESEEKFKVLFENAPDAYYLNDLEGNVIDGNKASEELLGYKKDELKGKNFLEAGIMPPDQISKAAKILEKGFKGRPAGTEELELKRKDGSRISVEISSIPIKLKGEKVFLGIARDITERKRLGERLQQAQKMESIGTLAGGIAHDFNNVLYAMIGYTELTMGDIPEDSLAQKNLKEVLKSAMRAKDMVQQILAFSRKANTEKKPIKIQSIVSEALKLLRPSIPSTIEIRQDINEDCGPVMADSTQIHQVVMNLATNAYQSMREKGGLLELTLSEEEISSDDSDRDLYPGSTYLKLTVSDTGHGMDNVIMKKIFDPYFSTKGPGEGTGMGLAVIHGIVNDHGGDIKVFSKIDEGSTFHVYFPRIETGSVEPETVTKVPTPTGTERILLVDDEEAIAFMTHQTLERLGYQVTSRTSSVEALEAFKVKPDEFDLVITDMTMPNMTGVELTSRLKEIRSDIPIIICTGFSEMIDKDKAKSMGILAYIMKPIIKDEIAGTVRKVLDK